jgi:3-oxoacyl-[acyl-carrier protein] reductase
MSPSLAGKRIAITGASSGIGRAIAIACAEHGATVAIGFHRGRQAAEDLAQSLQARGAACELMQLDVRDSESIAAAIHSFGHERGIDGLVAAAGVNRAGLLVATEPERLREQLEVNLLGPMLCAREALPMMMRARSGVVLFVGSVAAVRPVRGQAAYAASKGGLEALTRALAVEYAKKGIRVLCLRPGATDTPMLATTRELGEDELIDRIPARRVANPEEIAAHAVFLLGDGARYATGSCHTVDGGYLVG